LKIGITEQGYKAENKLKKNCEISFICLPIFQTRRNTNAQFFLNNIIGIMSERVFA